jgi:hypothetical protein
MVPLLSEGRDRVHVAKHPQRGAVLGVLAERNTYEFTQTSRRNHEHQSIHLDLHSYSALC